MLLALAFGRPAAAQTVPVGDPLEEYARVLQLEGLVPASSFGVRPYGADVLFGRIDTSAAHPWKGVVATTPPDAGTRLAWGLLPARWRAYWNSARPGGMNDGMLWQGRGATTALSAGAYVRLGPLSAALYPTVAYHQNRAFELSPIEVNRRFSPFAYNTLATRSSDFPSLGSTIDMPQRFGPDPFTCVDWGQSYVRLDWAGLAAGVANENMWWGPGVRNAIVMSNHAAGFRHVFLGTSWPLDVWAGHLEGRWVWGRLDESRYYDLIPENDHRYYTAITLQFQPRWVPGLSLGASRAFVQQMHPDGVGPGDYFLVFQDLFKKSLASDDNPGGLDLRDQLLSVTARWLFPESGFELYGEWGRGDHSWDVRDFAVEPQHGSGYTLGLQRVFGQGSRRRVLFTTEITKLESPKTRLVRGIGGYFYEHTRVRQGYTHQGQVLGAGIGPGSNSQFVGLKVFDTDGSAGVFLQRLVLNNDRYYRTDNPDHAHQETELSAGAQAMRFVGPYQIEGIAALGYLLNRYYETSNDQLNVHLGITVRRAFGGGEGR